MVSASYARSLVLDPTALMVGALPVLAFVWWLSTRRPQGLPPGPGGALPFLGHMHLMEQDMRNILKKWQNRYGDVFSFYMGGRLVVVLCGYQAIKDAMVKMADVFSDRPAGMFVTEKVAKSKGILNSSGATWKEQKKTTLDVFRDLGVGRNQLGLKIQEEVVHYIQEVKQFNGEPVQLEMLTRMSICNNICSIMFGKRFDYDDVEFRTCNHYIHEMVYNTGMAAVLNFFPWLDSLPGDLFCIKHMLVMVEEVNAFIRKQARAHYHQRQQTRTSLEGGDVGSTQTYRKKSADVEGEKLGADKGLETSRCPFEAEATETSDFIHRYLDAMDVKHRTGEETSLDESNLEQSLLDMFVAGTETIAISIGWALLLFLHHPEVQDRCFQEISDVIGRRRAPTLRDRPELVFLEATIMEVQRWAAVVPIAVPHGVTRDVTFHGYFIPEGSIVMPFLGSVLNDPEVWGDPESFRPDRFISPDGKLVRREELIPFGAGRRLCIGESLARMELFLYLSTLLQHFRFLPPEPETLPPLTGVLGFSHSPTPYRLRAVPRP